MVDVSQILYEDELGKLEAMKNNDTGSIELKTTIGGEIREISFPNAAIWPLIAFLDQNSTDTTTLNNDTIIHD